MAVPAGWVYNAAAGGYVRPDTTYNAATRQFDTPNSVGGTIFIPLSAVRAANAPASSGATASTLPAATVRPATAMPVGGGVSYASVAAPAKVTAKPIQTSLVNYQAPSADAMGVSNVRAQNVDPFMVEDPEILKELDRQAQAELALGGYLSPEEMRKSQQDARSAFAARGMVHSDPAALAEVLNRDQFSQARQAERRTFASQVSGLLTGIDQGNAAMYNDVQTANAARGLQAGIANQGTRLAQWQTSADAGLRVALNNATEQNANTRFNETNRMSGGQFNTDAGLRAALANQSAGLQAAGINQNAAQANAQNALGYASLAQEGALGAFNAQTARMNALAQANQAAAGGTQTYQYLQGLAANRQTSLGTSAAESGGGGYTAMQGLVYPRRQIGYGYNNNV